MLSLALDCRPRNRFMISQISCFPILVKIFIISRACISGYQARDESSAFVEVRFYDYKQITLLAVTAYRLLLILLPAIVNVHV